MCVPSPLLVDIPRNMPYQLVVASLGNLLHVLYAAHVHAKPSLGMNTLQHALLACCSVSRQLVAHSLCSLCACQILSWYVHLATCPYQPAVCIYRPLVLLEVPTSHVCVFPLHLYQGNLLMHLSCCYCGSLPCPNPLLDTAMSHDIVLMTPHLLAQGIAPLCQASHTSCLSWICCYCIAMACPSSSWCCNGLWHWAHGSPSLLLAQSIAPLCHLSFVIGHLWGQGAAHEALVPHALSQGANSWLLCTQTQPKHLLLANGALQAMESRIKLSSLLHTFQ